MAEMRGGSPSHEEDALDEHQAITLLLAAGHSLDGIGDMSPANFHAFLRASLWLHNRRVADNLVTTTRACAVGFRGDESAFSQLEELEKNLRAAHKNV